MWWAVWCAAVVLGRTAAAPATDNLASLPAVELAQIDPPAPDDVSLSSTNIE